MMLYIAALNRLHSRNGSQIYGICPSSTGVTAEDIINCRGYKQFFKSGYYTIPIINL